MKRFLSGFLVFYIAIPLCALANDPLTLTDSQIQKLKQYLPRENQPTEDETAPIFWKGDPIAITLPVGQEKRLIFPEAVQADLNGSLTTDQLRIINNDQNLYLTAQKAFSTTRMYVTLKNSRDIILIDLATSPSATHTTRTIALAAKKDHPAMDSSIVEASALPNQASNSSDYAIASADSYVNAIRFAWQQLYAPQRLLSYSTDFTRTPMHTQNWVPSLVYGDKVFAHPEVSWTANGLYITAVELRNKYPHPTRIHLSSDLCGHWLAAALYPRHNLKAAGDQSGDSTLLFLISNKSFGDVLQVCHGGA